MSKTLLVTGAAGFIGSFLAAVFVCSLAGCVTPRGDGMTAEPYLRAHTAPADRVSPDYSSLTSLDCRLGGSGE